MWTSKLRMKQRVFRPLERRGYPTGQRPDETGSKSHEAGDLGSRALRRSRDNHGAMNVSSSGMPPSTACLPAAKGDGDGEGDGEAARSDHRQRPLPLRRRIQRIDAREGVCIERHAGRSEVVVDALRR